MSVKENPCKKFQANIFNKSKCQNCFKPRESHLLTDEDLNQAKPIYGGWLLLAPEGTDFDNPMHRSRKWQRRFFILYEHGLLRYALDEMPTTLPQGTINMNQCTDVIDGESRTGQKFSLCILTPEEHFIRAENKEIINGWLEMLAVYPKTNKQNQKKKRKVEPPTPQEPGPAKMAVTSSGIPSAEKIPATKSTLWQEEPKSKEVQENSSPVQSPVEMPSSPSEPMPDKTGLVNGDRSDSGRKTRVESGYFSLEKTKDLKSEEQTLQTPPSPSTPDAPSRKSLVIEKFEALDIEKAEHMETSCSTAQTSEARQGRSEKRTFPRKREESGVGAIPDVSATHMSPYRRAKSLDRRSTESSMTPDLLNFKKGWLTKQYQDGQWKKHWFVLTDQNLRYYRDSVAEEAADLDGEIDLSTCYDVTEHPVQRNYGFQIHTKEGEFTLSAMTSGIRRNWIQTIMKHVRPSTAPDVTSSLPEEKSKTSSSYSSLHGDKQESEHSDADMEQKRSRARERRREGRSKTFDWAEFRPIQQALAQERAQAAEALKSISSYDDTDSKNDLGELERERARRREERRKRFENSDSVEESTGEDGSRMEVDKGPVSSANMDFRPNVQVEIEQRWQQVETTPLREEKQIPISPLPSASQNCTSEDITVLLEKQLEQSQKEVSELLEQNLVLQQRLKEALEQQQSARDGYVLQTELADPSSDAWKRLHKVNEELQNELEAQCRRQEILSHQMQTIKHIYGEAKDSIRHHEAETQRLHARLSSTVTELSIKEQALSKLKGDLELEKEKTREVIEEGQSSESALSAQLKASQQRLKEAESLLLEKSQELRELETEQALQRDYQKEMQRLQEKLVDLSSQLSTSERAQALTEERLQKNYEDLLGSCEKEKQLLLQNLRESEARLVDCEDKLQENEQLMEVLLKEKLNANAETSIIVHHLEEQLARKDSKISKLEAYVKDLEEEVCRLKSTCQELTNQIRVSDTENANLQARLNMQEVDYYELGNSLEKASKELLSIQRLLKEKEEELRRISETHRKVVGKKDQDINEALIKMAALGSSLEETENKLKDKEAALSRLCSFNCESQTKEIEKLRAELEAAKTRIVELEENLQVQKSITISEVLGTGSPMEISQRQLGSSLNAIDLGTYFSAAERGQDIGAKRQRIRFSSIQCQKYVQAEGSEKAWTSITSDTSQDQSFSEENTSSEVLSHSLSSGASDNSYLSIIHSLEAKLHISEEKLMDITLKLETEKSCNQETLLDLQNQWAMTESSLREQLQSSISHISTLAKRLEEVEREKFELMQGQTAGVQEDSACCSKVCTKTLQELHEDTSKHTVSTLSIEPSLSDAFHSSQKTLKGELSEEYPSDNQCNNDRISEASLQPCEDPLQLIIKIIDFESKLMNAIAESLKLQSPETSQGKGCVEVGSRESIVEMFVKKLNLERDFWSRVETLGAAIVASKGYLTCETEINLCSSQGLLQTLADNTLIKAELSSVTQKMEYYHEQMNNFEIELQKAKSEVEEKCTLEGGTGSYKPLNYGQVVHPCTSHLQPRELPIRWKELPANTTLSFQEELSHHLKAKADILKEISSTLLLMPSNDSQIDIQTLLDISRYLSCCGQALSSSNVPSVYVQDAIVQAQLCYVNCKTSLECERKARKEIDDLCREHTNALVRVHEEYQEMLQKKQNELSTMMVEIEKERSAVIAINDQVEDAKRCLDEAEAKFNSRISQLESSFGEEIQKQREKWTERENVLIGEKSVLINRLEVSEQERQTEERNHLEQIRDLEVKSQAKIHELQTTHRDEFQCLEDRYTQSIQQLQDTLDTYQREHLDLPSPGVESSTSWFSKEHGDTKEAQAMNTLRERIVELEAEMDVMRDEHGHKHLEGSVSMLKEKYQNDFENLKATCERGFAAMEETHQKKIEDLQRQHQRELEKLRDEKDRLLAEETAATISAIEAMKNAHREELERELEKTHRSQISSVNADVESLRRQYLEELQSIQRELEVLSEQYSQKCLENAHLVQALEAERQALRQCQRENQELNAHNQELNNRLATEITRLRMLLTGDGDREVSPLTQGKDAYELEVLLRVKESEIQYQKQEISSLKDELHTALRDKKYASDKYKDIYSELSNVKAKAECDISRLKEQLKVATEMLGDKSPENASVSGYDIMKSKSNPDFLKNDRSSVHRQLRNIRSKSVIEQVSWDN